MSLKKNLKIKDPQFFFFFDESRFGTHSNIGHGWFKKGERTSVDVKLGFENFYVYSAVNPFKGSDFTLKMPHVNTDCMNVFLAEMSKELGKNSAQIVMDGAGWHKSRDLKIPQNITIIYLPPYCPELNPVERLWLYMKQNTIKNKIYETIEELENAVCDFIKNFNKETIMQICNFNYIV